MPEDGHNYGVRIRVRSGQYQHVYAHLLHPNVTVGEQVYAGQLIGWADNTGRSNGSHLHLTLKHDDAVPGGSMYIGYPYNIINPTFYLPPLTNQAEALEYHSVWRSDSSFFLL